MGRMQDDYRDTLLEEEEKRGIPGPGAPRPNSSLVAGDRQVPASRCGEYALGREDDQRTPPRPRRPYMLKSPAQACMR